MKMLIGWHDLEGISLGYYEEILFPEFVMPGGLLPTLWGYTIFQNVNHTTIIAHYNLVGMVEEIEFIHRLNFQMSGIRQSIDWDDLFFILNCYTCLKGSACNSMFSTMPTSLQEYILLE